MMLGPSLPSRVGSVLKELFLSPFQTLKPKQYKHTHDRAWSEHWGSFRFVCGCRGWRWRLNDAEDNTALGGVVETLIPRPQSRCLRCADPLRRMQRRKNCHTKLLPRTDSGSSGSETAIDTNGRKPRDAIQDGGVECGYECFLFFCFLKNRRRQSLTTCVTRTN